MDGRSEDTVWFMRATTGERHTTLTPWARRTLESNVIPEAERERFIVEYRNFLAHRRTGVPSRSSGMDRPA